MFAICRRFNKENKSRTRTDITQLTESYTLLKNQFYLENGGAYAEGWHIGPVAHVP